MDTASARICFLTWCFCFKIGDGAWCCHLLEHSQFWCFVEEHSRCLSDPHNLKINSCVLWHKLCLAVPTSAHSCIAVSEHGRLLQMQGNFGVLNKNAFIAMLIQKPLSKEHPVLAYVWSVLPLLVDMPCVGAGNVEMGCAGLSSCMEGAVLGLQEKLLLHCWVPLLLSCMSQYSHLFITV